VRLLKDYGYSDCVLCDIVAHKPWEPANFVYEDEDVGVFHNILNWIPVMLLAVPRAVLSSDAEASRHYEQRDLWRSMGHLGAVAMALGRTHCQFDGQAQFRLVSNFGPLAMQSQTHAHIHVLGDRFPTAYPDLRCTGRAIYEDTELQAFSGEVPRSGTNGSVQAIMVVPRAQMSQDEYFASMQQFGGRVLEIAERAYGSSFRLLAELGPHSPTPPDGAHVFILGGVPLGHYV
jgi:diadenosine tetraphosphate (Ap4A) HIT family hydrolase